MFPQSTLSTGHNFLTPSILQLSVVGYIVFCKPMSSEFNVRFFVVIFVKMFREHGQSQNVDKHCHFCQNVDKHCQSENSLLLNRPPKL